MDELIQCEILIVVQTLLAKFPHMPVRSVIRKELRLAVTLEEGRVTFDDIRANQDRLLKNPGSG